MIPKYQTVIFTYLCLFILSSSLFGQGDKSNATFQSSENPTEQLLQEAKEAGSLQRKTELIEQAIDQVTNQPDCQLIIDTYHRAGILYYESNAFEPAQKYLELVISTSEAGDEYTLKIASSYHHLGWIATHWKDYPTAIELLVMAEQQYEKGGSETDQGNVFNSIGAVYWYQREYGKALDFFNKALEIGQVHEDVSLQQKALTNRGIVFENLAQYTEALHCVELALELNQMTQNKENRAYLLNNLGNIQQSLQHYDAALNAYQEALGLFHSLKNEQGASLCYNNIGEAYLEKGLINKAIENYQTSLTYERGQDDSLSMAIAYINIGRAHQADQNHSKSLAFCQKALAILERYDDESLEAEVYLHLGQNQLFLENNQQAREHLQRSIELSEKIGEKAKLAKGYNSMAELFEKMKNYQRAYHYKTLYASIKDSILIDNAMQNSARMTAVYNLLKKEETISRLEQEKRIQNRSLIKERSTKAAAIIISLLMIALTLVLFLIFQMRRKSASQLTQKNEELKRLNATKDKFFSIIAHDLKSPFSSLMGFAEMLTLHAESKNTDEVIEYSQIIHNSTKRVLGLVENLLQWSRTQLGTTHYQPEQLDVSIQAQNIVSLLCLNAEEKDIVISPKIEKGLVAYADQNLFSTVLRNLISNAIKFSRVGSVIYVSAKRQADLIEVAIMDSGVGIRQEDMEKLFQVDSTFSTKGTFNEKGTGLGLVLCKEFVEINKGEIWVESQLEKGSTFFFSVPLYMESQN